MSNKRNHRREAEGRKPKGRRMPKTSETKMGTQIHDLPVYEEKIPEIAKCPGCERFVEVDELEDFNGVCYDCWSETIRNAE